MTESVIWGVKDTNATKGARRHHIDGKDYDLTATAHTPVPKEHAVRFLRDPSFAVIDEYGEPAATMAQQSVSQPGRLPPLLAPGQVVANLDELLTTALLARAVQLPNGKGFTNSTKKDALIKALFDAGAAPRSPQNPAPDGTEPVDVEELSDVEAAALGPDLMGA